MWLQVYLKRATPVPEFNSIASSSGNGAWQPGTEGTIVKPDKQAAKAERDPLPLPCACSFLKRWPELINAHKRDASS